ncbi:MAG TPA: PKD domain-containing protein [Candidatus Thermoplasmatota archaeon]|nr:PKD domain-containing protein [Candidatus Thermoplasmatota archaeon]
MRRPAAHRFLPLLAIALLAVSVLPAAVEADHTYAHRYYLTGRIVDAEGYPLSNVTVRAILDSGVAIQGTNRNEQAFRVYQTDCDGFYGWLVSAERYRNRDHPTVTHSFLHAHDAAATGTLDVEAVDAPFPEGTGYYPGSERQHFEEFREAYMTTQVLAGARVPVDPIFREAFVPLQLQNGTAVGERCDGAKERSDREYHVFGHVMREIPKQRRDGGANVVSEPVVGETALVTLRYNDGLTATGRGVTDIEGHYALLLNLTEPLRAGELTINTNGTTQVYEANARYGATSVETIPGKARAPLAAFTATASGLQVTVDAKATTAVSGTLRGFSWDWGDGSAASEGPQATHTYATPGTYTVRLKVVDSNGGIATLEKSVVVAAASGPTAGEPSRDAPAASLLLALGAVAALALLRRRA